MNSIVSIIVPVFNNENNLRNCLESIVGQSLLEIEIIIIDDCSQDRSLKIAQEFALTDNRIRIFQNTCRLGSYRNRQRGVNETHTEFIQFANADGWLEPYSTQLMYQMIKRADTDLVQMRSQKIIRGIEPQHQMAYNSDFDGKRIDGKNFRSLASFIGIGSYITPSCQDKLYKSELLKDSFQIDFNIQEEEQLINIQYLRYARSIVFMDYIGYNYRYSGNSTKYKHKTIADSKQIWHLKKILGQDKKYINEELAYMLRYHIHKLYTDLAWTREAIIYSVKKELCDPIWDEIGIENNAEDLVDIELYHIKHKPLKYFIKRLLQ